MIKAINDVVILEKTEEKTSDGGIYLSEKRKDEVELAKVLSIKEEDETHTNCEIRARKPHGYGAQPAGGVWGDGHGIKYPLDCPAEIEYNIGKKTRF